MDRPRLSASSRLSEKTDRSTASTSSRMPKSAKLDTTSAPSSGNAAATSPRKKTKSRIP